MWTWPLIKSLTPVKDFMTKIKKETEDYRIAKKDLWKCGFDMRKNTIEFNFKSNMSVHDPCLDVIFQKRKTDWFHTLIHSYNVGIVTANFDLFIILLLWT